MTDEALKSLKILFVSSLAVLVLWFLTWPAAVEKLTQYRDARDLHAWLLLKELPPDLNVFDVAPDQPISAYDVERDSPTPQGGDYTERITLTIRTAWPSAATHPITLRPDGAYSQSDPEITQYARIYRVESLTTELPLSDYLVVFLQDAPSISFVVPHDDEAFRAGRERGLRMIMVAGRSRSLPRHWSSLAPRMPTISPQELTTANPALTRLYEESDPRQRSGGVVVFGIPLNISMFYSSIGFVLGALAFATIGPLAFLRASQKPPADVWILSLPRRKTIGGRLLEFFIFLVTLAWALAPLAILVLQSVSGIVLEGWEIWMLRLGAASLIFASFVFVLAAIELRRVRTL